jgi:hypothetical protein
LRILNCIRTAICYFFYIYSVSEWVGWWICRMNVKRTRWKNLAELNFPLEMLKHIKWRGNIFLFKYLLLAGLLTWMYSYRIVDVLWGRGVARNFSRGGQSKFLYGKKLWGGGFSRFLLKNPSKMNKIFCWGGGFVPQYPPWLRARFRIISFPLDSHVPFVNHYYKFPLEKKQLWIWVQVLRLPYPLKHNYLLLWPYRSIVIHIFHHSNLYRIEDFH